MFFPAPLPTRALSTRAFCSRLHLRWRSWRWTLGSFPEHLDVPLCMTVIWMHVYDCYIAEWIQLFIPVANNHNSCPKMKSELAKSEAWSPTCRFQAPVHSIFNSTWNTELENTIRHNHSLHILSKSYTYVTGVLNSGKSRHTLFTCTQTLILNSGKSSHTNIRTKLTSIQHLNQSSYITTIHYPRSRVTIQSSSNSLSTSEKRRSFWGCFVSGTDTATWETKMINKNLMKLNQLIFFRSVRYSFNSRTKQHWSGGKTEADGRGGTGELGGRREGHENRRTDSGVNTRKKMNG